MVQDNALLFLSEAPTHDGFTSNLQFLYELKYKIRLSKTVCDICVSWSSPKTDLVTNFLDPENRSFETT